MSVLQIKKPSKSFTRIDEGIYSMEVLVTKGDVYDSREEYQMRIYEIPTIQKMYMSGRYYEIEQVMIEQLGEISLVRETLAKICNKFVKDHSLKRVGQDVIKYI